MFHDKDALALVWGIKKFHTYIFTRWFTLQMGHQPLNNLQSHKPHFQRYGLFYKVPMGHYLILHKRSINLHLLSETSKIPLIFHIETIKLIILLPNLEIMNQWYRN